MDKAFRISRSARKHHISAGRIREAMSTAGAPEQDGDALLFVGTDSRGVELEIAMVPNDKGPGWTVIHAMPTHYRE